MYSEVPPPPIFIIHTPGEFNRWAEWARDFKKDDYKGMFQPFGVEFDIDEGIDGFINYYSSLRSKGKYHASI